MKTMMIKSMARRVPMVAVVVATMALAACEPYNNRPNYPVQQGGYSNRCLSCGVVQDVQQVYTQGGGNGNGGTLGAVIGAVAGGVLGSTIGKGDGRTAATVAGAVGGGVIGNQVGKRNDGGSGTAFRIVIRMDNGQYATVTQAQDPGVRNGDYVSIHDGLVYRR
jgi:outer membrane lipoprotein SlyB